ncbi:class I SAM-dependent methyltransferase [Streptomyces sp. BR123]|uniref:class I SAM-dependent methyltransferase n=1 Tax=Streptomyces sp. BR123 TaxID=2749828 RepID=UPI0015C469A3|nr:class I SAM-dependent methyltransferase [Streptomyces sp. BR123]NXY96422.1 class I SAM-dependent methyltransferase [Streptomyces sp. BR123]
MSDATDPVAADLALKARHRAMWAMGDYPSVASHVVPENGAELVRECGVRQGDRVLDIAAGSGNAAIPAALTGADVVASDLTPELLEVGQHLATLRGARLEWREADAEHLPFTDGEFDVVMSCFGIMFAPHHQTAADEMLRVCRPGGTVGLANWTPEGFIGRMFATMKPYAPPPPPGAQPPPLWGDEEHVYGLLGDRVTDVDSRRTTVRVDAFPDRGDFRTFFKACYGPTIAVYRALGNDHDRVAALDGELDALAEENTRDGVMEWEYLLLTAHRTS